jgi:hypothetical protein
VGLVEVLVALATGVLAETLLLHQEHKVLQQLLVAEAVVDKLTLMSAKLLEVLVEQQLTEL